MAILPTEDITIFYCYARKDKALRDEMEIHLSPLKRCYHLVTWSDKEITAGEEWEKAIDKHLGTAHIILLLISPDFIASEYCYSTEMNKALTRHAEGTCRVIPILLRPTHWEGTPFSKLQMLPTNARPVTRWQNRDEAFKNITEGIEKYIKELKEAFLEFIDNLEPLPPLDAMSRSSSEPQLYLSDNEDDFTSHATASMLHISSESEPPSLNYADSFKDLFSVIELITAKIDEFISLPPSLRKSLYIYLVIVCLTLFFGILSWLFSLH